ncbi:hypothetical protein [Alteribacillus iranensis]|uniref:hypothetical protein n=1 Tax=Alteribacillus iranensis TaxID=930128 RepID=UPI000B80CD26
MVVLFILFSAAYFFIINSMINALCIKKEIPDERHPKIFRTINILITILCTSTFIELLLI